MNKYVDFKLKIIEGENRDIDQSPAFLRELGSYKDQLAQPYLLDGDTQEKLMQEAYQRLQEEVNVSHIMIEVAEDAAPQDTLKAYNTIIDLRKKALAGENFEELASTYSQDPKAKENKGNLGYFTALQMVYPFENASYKTSVGNISDLLRTRYGYHFLKVINRRKAQGKISTAHIMLNLSQNAEEEVADQVKAKILDIYNRLKKGENYPCS